MKLNELFKEFELLLPDYNYSNVLNCITELYAFFVKDGSLYKEVLDKDDFYTEISFEEMVEELLKNSEEVTEFNISIDHVFDSPGSDIYSVSIAWIENGHLQTFFEAFERC